MRVQLKIFAPSFANLEYLFLNLKFEITNSKALIFLNWP